MLNARETPWSMLLKQGPTEKGLDDLEIAAKMATKSPQKPSTRGIERKKDSTWHPVEFVAGTLSSDWCEACCKSQTSNTRSATSVDSTLLFPLGFYGGASTVGSARADCRFREGFSLGPRACVSIVLHEAHSNRWTSRVAVGSLETHQRYVLAVPVSLTRSYTELNAFPRATHTPAQRSHPLRFVVSSRFSELLEFDFLGPLKTASACKPYILHTSHGLCVHGLLCSSIS